MPPGSRVVTFITLSVVARGAEQSVFTFELIAAPLDRGPRAGAARGRLFEILILSTQLLDAALDLKHLLARVEELRLEVGDLRVQLHLQIGAADRADSVSQQFERTLRGDQRIYDVRHRLQLPPRAWRQVAVDDRGDGAVDCLEEVRQIVEGVQPDVQLPADGASTSVDARGAETDVTDVRLNRVERELCARDSVVTFGVRDHTPDQRRP